MSDHRVSRRAQAALAGLQKLGVRPIVLTGRSEGEALRICRDAGITAPAISCNGALTTDPVSGKRLRQVAVSAEMLQAAASFAERHDVQLLLWTPDGVCADHASPQTELLEEINREPVAISPLVELAPEQVLKVMLTAAPAVLDELAPAARVEVPFLERSMGIFLEATHPDATKWQSLRRILDDLDLAPEDCVGIADGDNDLEWLANIGLPIAVANARPRVLRAVERVIGPNTEESVAALLEAWAAHLGGQPAVRA